MLYLIKIWNNKEKWNNGIIPLRNYEMHCRNDNTLVNTHDVIFPLKMEKHCMIHLFQNNIELKNILINHISSITLDCWNIIFEYYSTSKNWEFVQYFIMKNPFELNDATEISLSGYKINEINQSDNINESENIIEDENSIATIQIEKSIQKSIQSVDENKINYYGTNIVICFDYKKESLL